MKLAVLGSGSKGNSIFLETDNIKLLIDAGFSGKKIEEQLKNIGENICNIDGILITHEHGDHILGAGIISRKYDVPIYITKESYEAGILKLGKLNSQNLRFIEENFEVGASLIYPFDVMHDAERTVGFRIEESTGSKVAIATDLGYIDNTVREAFKNVDVIVLECNYDYNKLMECSYPWDLKARVKSRSGHLSNIDCARFLCEIYHKDLKKIYLAHMSKESNDPKLALDEVMEELSKNNIEIPVEIATQDRGTKLIDF
ncbi:MAG: MBL fold metallo-hydrolase [Cetobacterium sp.]|uniref:MBL fold metallo-hydrolase n=1 Tax=Cetobacterium sp. TaxID=2071632 RepID=UPI003F38DD67